VVDLPAETKVVVFCVFETPLSLELFKDNVDRVLLKRAESFKIGGLL